MTHKKKTHRNWWRFSKYSTAIRDLFIRPLLSHCPGVLTSSQFLERIFGTHERTIKRYRVKAQATVPGIMVEGRRRTQGVGYKRLKEGALLLVRHDETRPRIYEVEYYQGVGNKEHVMEVDVDDWLSLRQHLEELEERKE